MEIKKGRTSNHIIHDGVEMKIPSNEILGLDSLELTLLKGALKSKNAREYEDFVHRSTSKTKKSFEVTKAIIDNLVLFARRETIKEHAAKKKALLEKEKLKKSLATRKENQRKKQRMLR